MRKVASFVLVLALVLGIVPTFSTPAHAWGRFSFQSIRQTAINFLVLGCLFNCGFGEVGVEEGGRVSQTIVQVGVQD
jgi:hypothetical protein